jgi:hypothetical protein
MKNKTTYGIFNDSGSYIMVDVNIYGILTSQIDLLFDSVCEEFNLESGDISPELQDRLDKCGEELLDILEKFVAQNKG